MHGVRRSGTPSASPSSRHSGSSARSSSPTSTIGVGPLRRARRAGDGGALLGRARRRRYAVAPAPHRRALRAVHDHRARRGDPRDHAGDLEHPGRARPRGPAADADRGRAADGVLDVVDLLQAAHGRLPQPRDRLRLRLRPLLRVRVRGRGRRLPGRAGRRHRAPRGHRVASGRAAPRRGSERLPARDLRAAQPRRPRALHGRAGADGGRGDGRDRTARARTRHQRAAARTRPWRPASPTTCDGPAGRRGSPSVSA